MRIYITRNYNNSLGNGIKIYVSGESKLFPDRYYYGYTKREAEKQYRKEYGLVGKKLEHYEY